jgi:hypothetical protein
MHWMFAFCSYFVKRPPRVANQSIYRAPQIANIRPKGNKSILRPTKIIVPQKAERPRLRPGRYHASERRQGTGQARAQTRLCERLVEWACGLSLLVRCRRHQRPTGTLLRSSSRSVSALVIEHIIRVAAAAGPADQFAGAGVERSKRGRGPICDKEAIARRVERHGKVCTRVN